MSQSTPSNLGDWFEGMLQYNAFIIWLVRQLMRPIDQMSNVRYGFEHSKLWKVATCWKRKERRKYKSLEHEKVEAFVQKWLESPFN